MARRTFIAASCLCLLFVDMRPPVCIFECSYAALLPIGLPTSQHSAILDKDFVLGRSGERLLLRLQRPRETVHPGDRHCLGSQSQSARDDRSDLRRSHHGRRGLFRCGPPRACRGLVTVSGRDAVVDLAPDVGELKATLLVLPELDERRDLLVDVVLVPFGHRDDVPAAEKRRHWRVRSQKAVISIQP